MKARFVTDSSGRRVTVLLPFKTFEKILEELDEFSRIEARRKKSDG